MLNPNSLSITLLMLWPRISVSTLGALLFSIKWFVLKCLFKKCCSMYGKDFVHPVLMHTNSQIHWIHSLHNMWKWINIHAVEITYGPETDWFPSTVCPWLRSLEQAPNTQTASWVPCMADHYSVWTSGLIKYKDKLLVCVHIFITSKGDLLCIFNWTVLREIQAPLVPAALVCTYRRSLICNCMPYECLLKRRWGKHMVT